MEEAPNRLWTKALPIAALSVVALVSFYYGAKAPEQAPAAAPLRVFNQVSQLQPESPDGFRVNPSANLLTVLGTEASFAVAFDAPVQGVILRFTPMSTFDPNKIVLRYERWDDRNKTQGAPEQATGPSQIAKMPALQTAVAAPPALKPPRETVLTWNLPEPAANCQITVPAGTSLILDALDCYAHLHPLKLYGHLRQRLPAFCGLLALVLAVQIAFGWYAFPAWRAKNILLIAWLLSAGIMVFLLPPFQGPDEIAHWKTALTLSRRNARAEAPLYGLNEILGTGRLPFQTEETFDARGLKRTPYAEETGFSDERVRYASFLSYPAVSLVALFYPPVNSVDDALCFYYLCRLLPLLALFGLLLILNRRYELPYLAWYFFTLPLVVQQFVVVSTDTLVNLGAVAAVVLFLEQRVQVRLWRLAGLWLLCIGITAAKVTSAGLLLLPLCATPWSRLPWKRAVITVLLFSAASAVALAVARSWPYLRGEGALCGTQNFDSQLHSLCTCSGLGDFLSAAWTSVIWPTDVEHFAGPLGWLDTNLNRFHIYYIQLGAGLALLLDAARCAAAVRGGWRPRAAPLALAIGIPAFNYVFIALAMSLLLYVTITGADSPIIVGFQQRYLFPALILAVLLPLVVSKTTPANERCSACRSLLQTAGITTLLAIFFVRQVELVADMMTRYW